MFKKLEVPTATNLLNKSAVRTIKKKLDDTYTEYIDLLEELIPKKTEIVSAKLKNGDYKVELFCNGTEILFF